jgi:cobalt transporter subunit CbtB
MVNFESNMEASQAIAISARPAAVAIRWPALGVFLAGLLIVYCVGFSTVSRAHNATHDTRHASGFPCH